MALVDYVDKLVLADTFAYSRQSFQNRTPIRTPNGRMWLSLPLRRDGSGASVAATRLSEDRWRGRHLRALTFNYNRTPFFEHYAEELRDFLARPWTSLGELTVASTRLLAKWLMISTPLEVLSESGGGAVDLRSVSEGSRRAEYVAGADTAVHDAAVMGIASVVGFTADPYLQQFGGFEPDLSALDLLFNWGREALPMLRSRRLVESGQAVVKPATGGDVC